MHSWGPSCVLRWREFFSCSCCLVAKSCLTLCDPMNRSTPGLPVHHQLPECTQTHVHRVSDAIQPSHPLLFPSPHALNLHQHLCFPKSRLFASGGQSLGACFSISPSSECSGLISFRMDWFDVLAVQGTLKCLLQHHSFKHQFFSTQPSLSSNSHIFT